MRIYLDFLYNLHYFKTILTPGNTPTTLPDRPGILPQGLKISITPWRDRREGSALQYKQFQGRILELSNLTFFLAWINTNDYFVRDKVYFPAKRIGELTAFQDFGVSLKAPFFVLMNRMNLLFLRKGTLSIIILYNKI